ncbi:10236_t:CDS:2 [Funneliformis mosseae]|uniref:10236_t:CDS:1 n=1 Tax=Funneliformis mosseae TaxID=27381 RepID=A0A9N8ZZ60_FUNMO|nr:10236_t:CDS:2 [Funneliformis mosseae]
MDEELEDTKVEALIFESDDEVTILQSRIVTFGNISKAQIYDSDGENMGIDPFRDYNKRFE